MSYSQAFEVAFDRTFGHEGGYQCIPTDPGNWTGGRVGDGELVGTRFGVSAASYPDLDIKNLSAYGAKKIWHDDFWEPLQADRFHRAIAYQLFDAGIHHGITGATKILQVALVVQSDGIIGPVTMRAAESSDPNDIVMRFVAERLVLLTLLGEFPEFGRGWVRRVARNLIIASEDN